MSRRTILKEGVQFWSLNHLDYGCIHMEDIFLDEGISRLIYNCGRVELRKRKKMNSPNIQTGWSILYLEHWEKFESVLAKTDFLLVHGSHVFVSVVHLEYELTPKYEENSGFCVRP